MDPSGMTRSEWREVMDAMEEVGPYYERVNRLITFGLVDRWRRRVASLAGPDDVVLEIGSGPGNFTRHLNAREIYAVDPSAELLAESRALVDPKRVILIRAVGERLPFAEGSVDKIFCAFSFRDFLDRRASAKEMFRVLREGGEVVILDMAKPPQGPLAKMLELHVKYLVPPLTRVAVPSVAKERWHRDPYKTFVETYKAFGTTEDQEEILRCAGFEEVATDYLEMRGATVTRGKKPWKSTSS